MSAGPDEYGPGVTTARGEYAPLEAAVRRNISGNWSLASDVWQIGYEEWVHNRELTFSHRDSISRIVIYSDEGFVDVDPIVEVYVPQDEETARLGPEDDVNDVLVTTKQFDLLPEAVWFCEFYARNINDYIPPNPASVPFGPLDGGEE